jgi:AcrR family transcriptional regulator
VPQEGGGAIDGLRERKRAVSHARVIEAAFDLFAERGCEEVTVAEICAAADIAPRTFFRYFPTKDDVLAEPARSMADRMREELRAVPAELSDADALAAAAMALGAQLVTDREKTTRYLRVLRQAAVARSHPVLRIGDRERALAEVLVARNGGAPIDWRVRLAVARTTAAFRVWLDDLVDDVAGDPLEHLREIIA